METQLLAELPMRKKFPRAKVKRSTRCVKAQLSGASEETIQLEGKQ